MSIMSPNLKFEMNIQFWKREKISMELNLLSIEGCGKFLPFNPSDFSEN